VNDKQDYTFGNLTGDPDNIYALNMFTEVRKDDATARGVTSFIKSDATEVSGSEYLTITSYRNHSDIHLLDPDGDVAWVTSQVNAIIAGQKITT